MVNRRDLFYRAAQTAVALLFLQSRSGASSAAPASRPAEPGIESLRIILDRNKGCLGFENKEEARWYMKSLLVCNGMDPSVCDDDRYLVIYPGEHDADPNRFEPCIRKPLADLIEGRPDFDWTPIWGSGHPMRA